MSIRLTAIIISVILFDIGLLGLVNHHKNPVINPIVPPQQFDPLPVKPPEELINYTISNPKPPYLDNKLTIEQLQQWHQEAPKLTEIGVYGKTSKSKDIYYIRITNPNKDNKKTVLITACIHGNEPLASSVVMNYIGTILDQYGDDSQITELLNTRDIYFIPIVSPDSYPHSRYVDNVNPNRDFPTLKDVNKKSIPPIQALREFFLKIKPNAVISGHTSGRVLLIPWGDQMQVSPNDADFKKIIGEMSHLCQYQMKQACYMYNEPIYGSELDWYYRHQAFSIVMEFGTHQNIPSRKDIDEEFNRTFKGVLLFIDKAPEVKIGELK